MFSTECAGNITIPFMLTHCEQYQHLHSVDWEKSGGAARSSRPSAPMPATKTKDRFIKGSSPFVVTLHSSRSLHPWQGELDLLSAGKRRTCFLCKRATSSANEKGLVR
jgi:hypothetical protein